MEKNYILYYGRYNIKKNGSEPSWVSESNFLSSCNAESRLGEAIRSSFEFHNRIYFIAESTVENERLHHSDTPIKGKMYYGPMCVVEMEFRNKTEFVYFFKGISKRPMFPKLSKAIF